ncbi:MAG: hypothetical protein J6X57_05865 [Bacteroidales bacterium]|nr:hypothetical protein [Bacteroidales bacterium]
MADNYIENKMEEFRQGAKVVRRQGTSLEGLLEIVASEEEAAPAADKAAAVMPAQLEAVVRAAKHLPEAADFRFEVDEAASVIRILGPCSPRRHLINLGQVILAMRLKAAELHLYATAEVRTDAVTPANRHLATLTLLK